MRESGNHEHNHQHSNSRLNAQREPANKLPTVVSDRWARCSLPVRLVVPIALVVGLCWHWRANKSLNEKYPFRKASRVSSSVCLFHFYLCLLVSAFASSRPATCNVQASRRARHEESWDNLSKNQLSSSSILRRWSEIS